MLPVPAMTRRPTDAGTTNEYTVVGGMKVHVWRGGLPAVLDREPHPSNPLIAVRMPVERGGQTITMTPHQARALAAVLPAAAALADREED